MITPSSMDMTFLPEEVKSEHPVHRALQHQTALPMWDAVAAKINSDSTNRQLCADPRASRSCVSRTE